MNTSENPLILEQLAALSDATRCRLLLVLGRHELTVSELCEVLLAVLSTEGLGEDSTPCILENEDRGWDPDTLADEMAALSGAPHQVILMSTVYPSTVPEGWTVIEVGS